MQDLRKSLGNAESALFTWVPYVHFGLYIQYSPQSHLGIYCPQEWCTVWWHFSEKDNPKPKCSYLIWWLYIPAWYPKSTAKVGWVKWAGGCPSKRYTFEIKYEGRKRSFTPLPLSKLVNRLYKDCRGRNITAFVWVVRIIKRVNSKLKMFKLWDSLKQDEMQAEECIYSTNIDYESL